jgi:hypothetical protein
MKENSTIDLSEILKPYIKDKLWVALYPDYKDIAGVGKTPKEALEQAKSNKIKNSILIQAVPDYSSYVTY